MKNSAHHFLGMFIAEWCLVRDVKDRNGTLRSVCEARGTAIEELLGAI